MVFFHGAYRFTAMLPAAQEQRNMSYIISFQLFKQFNLNNAKRKCLTWVRK